MQSTWRGDRNETGRCCFRLQNLEVEHRENAVCRWGSLLKPITTQKNHQPLGCWLPGATEWRSDFCTLKKTNGDDLPNGLEAKRTVSVRWVGRTACARKRRDTAPETTARRENARHEERSISSPRQKWKELQNAEIPVCLKPPNRSQYKSPSR